MREKNKKRISIILSVIMGIGILSQGGFYNVIAEDEGETIINPWLQSTNNFGINNPTIANDGNVTYDCISFGRYPQSDITGQTVEPIKWRVLSVDGSDAFLMADKVLDVMKYNEEKESVMWENSSLRNWLNGEFFNNAFNVSEQNAIKSSEVVNKGNPYSESDGATDGNITYDKVYIPSLYEITNSKYGFSEELEFDDELKGLSRIRNNTEYVKSGGSIQSSSVGNTYWLRTSGHLLIASSLVVNTGEVNEMGALVTNTNIGVCPVIHIDLSNEDTWSYEGKIETNNEVQNTELQMTSEVQNTELEMTSQVQNTELEMTSQEIKTSENKTTEQNTQKYEETEVSTSEMEAYTEIEMNQIFDEDGTFELGAYNLNVRKELNNSTAIAGVDTKDENHIKILQTSSDWENAWGLQLIKEFSGLESEKTYTIEWPFISANIYGALFGGTDEDNAQFIKLFGGKQIITGSFTTKEDGTGKYIMAMGLLGGDNSLDIFAPIVKDEDGNIVFSSEETTKEEELKEPTDVVAPSVSCIGNQAMISWENTIEQTNSGQLYNIYLDHIMRYSNVQAGAYSFLNLKAGTHTVKIVSILNGIVSKGIELSFDIEEDEITTTVLEESKTEEITCQKLAEIYSDEVTVSAGDEVTIPIKIRDNTGVMGFAFDVEYDWNILTPVAIESSNLTVGGIMNDSIDTSTNNIFKVCWANDSNITEDGILFYITFKVSEYARGKKQINLSCRQDETFNEYWKDVKLECNDILINVIEPQMSSVYLSSNDNLEVNCGNEVAVPISISNNTNTDSVSFDLKYDKQAFSIRTVEKIFEGEYSIKEISDGVHFEVSGIQSDEKLFTIYYSVTDYIGGEYRFSFENTEIDAINFSIKVNNANENARTIISGGSLAINENVLTVPVMVKNNKGIMGYKIALNYDEECLEPIEVTSGAMFKGNFANNIGVYSGKYSVLWSGNENVVGNGILFTATFKIKNENIMSTLIELQYSQADTFNESWEDVELDCKNIEIDVQKIKQEETETNQTTTEENTTEETTREENTTKETTTEKSTTQETITSIKESSKPVETTTILEPTNVLETTKNNIVTEEQQTTIKNYPTIVSTINAKGLSNSQSASIVTTQSYLIGVMKSGKGGMLTIPVKATSKSGNLIVEIKTSSKVSVMFMSNYVDMEYALEHTDAKNIVMNGSSGTFNNIVSAGKKMYVHLFDEKITKPINVYIKVYEYTGLSSKINKVKNIKGKKASLKWKKVKGISGYEVQMAMDKKFKKKVKTKTLKPKASTIIFKKLKKKKKYYFRIRVFKKIGNIKAYGNWSKVKNIIIKK